MSDDPVVTLRDLSRPENTERSGNLVSADPDWAELELADGGAPVSGGTLVGLQTSQGIYLGRVERADASGKNQRLRIRVDHWLALQDVSAVQKLWSQEQAD